MLTAPLGQADEHVVTQTWDILGLRSSPCSPMGPFQWAPEKSPCYQTKLSGSPTTLGTCCSKPEIWLRVPQTLLGSTLGTGFPGSTRFHQDRRGQPPCCCQRRSHEGRAWPEASARFSAVHPERPYQARTNHGLINMHA